MMFFKDRYDAAMKLIPFLEKYKNERGAVLAVPRGGVPLGYYISKHFGFPLELMLTKKIGHPESAELAVGAVSQENYIVDDHYKIPESYLENEIKRIRGLLKERSNKFLGNRKPVNIEGKTVIVIDDGIATGNTILAAIQVMKKKNPEKIIVAVPVAPSGTVNRIRRQVDDLICLYTPEEFYGVGQFYDDFSEVTDEDVIQFLKGANNPAKVF